MTYRTRLRVVHQIEPRLDYDPPWLRRVCYGITLFVSLTIGVFLWVVTLIALGVGQ